jgi:hypothetical protein
MKKLSGLVLDVYDDPGGEVLREIFPTYGQVPDLIKTAHHLTEEERRQLPDDLFALALIDGDVTLRKYACVDAGNTALAVEYFCNTAHKLPAEAQKVAAQNLITACSWYGLQPPLVLEKVAAGSLAWKGAKMLYGGPMGVGLAAATAPSVIQGARQTVGQGLQQARAAGAQVNPAIIQG